MRSEFGGCGFGGRGLGVGVRRPELEVKVFEVVGSKVVVLMAAGVGGRVFRCCGFGIWGSEVGDLTAAVARRSMV